MYALFSEPVSMVFRSDLTRVVWLRGAKIQCQDNIREPNKIGSASEEGYLREFADSDFSISTLSPMEKILFRAEFGGSFRNLADRSGIFRSIPEYSAEYSAVLYRRSYIFSVFGGTRSGIQQHIPEYGGIFRNIPLRSAEFRPKIYFFHFD